MTGGVQLCAYKKCNNAAVNDCFFCEVHMDLDGGKL